MSLSLRFAPFASPRADFGGCSGNSKWAELEQRDRAQICPATIRLTPDEVIDPHQNRAYQRQCTNGKKRAES